VNDLPKRVESNLLLPLLKSRGGQIAGGWFDPTHELKEEYEGHKAMLKTIKRIPKRAEEQKIGFIHETVYLEEEGMLLACAESQMLYFIVIKDNGYRSNKGGRLSQKVIKALGKRVRRTIDAKYGTDFVKW